ncbi:MAG: glycosyltransferase family 4 protein [Actinobacteria bacterium]|nr:glycosyltransferase family 4 protein [Actinomycetota bacterium]
MRIGIAKPDLGYTGGYERVIDRISAELGRDGHEIVWMKLNALDVPRLPYGVPLPRRVAPELWEFQRYVALMETFGELDTSGFDLMISTQAPSFAVEHDRHLSVFSHHHRIYYDLADVHVAAGFADPELHGVIASAARRLDQPRMEHVSTYLAASEEVKGRLERFNGLTKKVLVYHAGVAFSEAVPAWDAPRNHGEYAICVTRHEFPKRGELFVHALKYLSPYRGVVVGGGSRLPWLRAVDSRLSASGADLDALTDADLWLNRGASDLLEFSLFGSNVEFVEDASGEQLHHLYSGALCAVAPAYLEDYGLTGVEAMTYGLPLIVCSDGGGLTWFVEDGITGFVVEPTGRAIADAVERLRSDPELAAEMGRAARERARDFTWERAMDEIRRGVALAMAE